MNAIPSKLLSRRDLEFLTYEWLDAQALTARQRYVDHSRETFDAAMDTCEKLATDLFAPHYKKNDQHEPRFDGERVHVISDVGVALKAHADAGLVAACHDYDLGGMQLPVLVAAACSIWFSAANIGTASYPFLTVGGANLLLAHGTREQIDAYVRPMLSGRFFGTMCLSEPQAGSSLADIRTRALMHADGSYRLFGSKMWISGGDHELSENIVHLVLAKIPGEDGQLPAGVKGISLFIVPKIVEASTDATHERNDVSLAGLNHKMGHRGITNCLLNFGEGRFTPQGEPGAIGYLVGERGNGLAYMFHLMNEARIGVGVGATALGYTGYLHSLDYARSRSQGRLHADKDPCHPQVPIIAHADVKRMLLAQKSYVEGALALCLYCSRLVDEQKTGESDLAKREAELLLGILTPIAKSWPAQWCLAANDLAIQIHGGYGYTRDYNVEQHYRDNRLNSIHEGTHGIQALDLLGRKIPMADGIAFDLLIKRVQATALRCALAQNGDLTRYAERFTEQTQRLIVVTRQLCQVKDVDRRLANATIYMEAFGHIVIAWLWLEQALAALKGMQASDDRDFYAGKLSACRYFFLYELPKVTAMLNVLESLDATPMDMREEWF